VDVLESSSTFATKPISLYFTNFPDKSGVLELFNRSESDLYPDYAVLKTEIENLAVHSLVPGIKEYVFGVNFDSVKARIKELDGTYLFVDYGHIMTTEDDYERHSDDMLISLTLATPFKIEKLDHVEQVFMTDAALAMLMQIRAQMMADSEFPFVKQLNFPTEITPFFARELSDSTGWTMVFKKSGVGILD